MTPPVPQRRSSDLLPGERIGLSRRGGGEIDIPPGDRRRHAAATLHQQIMASGELLHALDETRVVGDVTKREEILDRLRADPAPEQRKGEQRVGEESAWTRRT